jgi:hypothetical protein
VGYGDFLRSRGLTRDFAEVFGERKCGGGLGAGTHIMKASVGHPANIDSQ